LNPDATRTRSGSGIYGLSTQMIWPMENRSPGKLALTANSKYFGRLIIEPGAMLRTDPLGEVNLTAGRQMTVDGTVEAPAGTIALQMALRTDHYENDKSIWLGSGSRLLAAGAVVREPNDLGLALGEVHDGGKVTVEAEGGYLVSEAGSVIDVSGTSAKLDIRPPAGSAATRRDVEVASDAGSIRLSAREGMLLDGSFARPCRQ
jgi:filamentous hemagglutinin